MFSKRQVVLSLMAFAFSMVGCGEFINGEKAKPEVIELSDERFACLSDIPASLKDFSVGEASDANISSGFACLTDALQYFNKRTFGATSGSYTVEEVRRFFGKYFLKKNNVTPEFAGELMKVKRALVGGSTASITKDEIVRLIEILSVVKEEALKISPHIKILLNHSTQQEADWERISTATEQLRHSLTRLLDKTQFAKSDYSFEDAKSLFGGFALFIKGGENFEPYNLYSRYVPIIESVKIFLMGKQASLNSVAQWKSNLNSLVDLYELFLKYNYSLKDLKFESPAKIRQLSQFAGQALKLVANSHQIRTNGVIPLADTDNLLEQLVPLLGISIKPISAKQVYRAILIKMLDPDRKKDSRELRGLEPKHLATLTREYNAWRLSQSFIDSVNFQNRGVRQSTLAAAYNSFDRNQIIERGLTEDPFEQRALRQSWTELGELLQAPRPVQFNAEGRLVVDLDSADIDHTWASLTKGNFMRILSRMLATGYGEDTGSGYGIKSPGLVLWYDEFRPVFTDLGAFDPRGGNSGARSFLEANFFTFSGDGNDVMNHKETFEFVSVLFAAGLSTSEKLRAHMVQAGCGINELDVFGKPFLKQACFQNELRRSFAGHFNNLPGMANYVRSLNDAQWNEFYTYLMSVSLVATQKTGYVETANIRTMVTILHYIESLMVTFDKDKNQLLSLDEVYAASPRFLSFLRTVGGTDNETFLREGFAYLVFRGSVPKIQDLGGFQFSKVFGLGEAERLQIVRIFGTLKDQLNKPVK